MVDLALLQSVSYIAGALGVCVAASYYVFNLRNLDRERRRQIIMAKLPPITREYYQWNLEIRNSWNGSKDWDEKYRLNPELESKAWYIMSIYNVVGQLYVEGFMSLEEISKTYSAAFLVGWWEMFEFYVKRIRFNSEGEDVNPDYLADFERLCLDLINRYPKVMEPQRVLMGELVEIRKRVEANEDSKVNSQ
jgi:hypothetical protein